MSKWYEVTIKVVQTVTVEVEDDQGENQAIDAAIDEIGLFACDVTESTAKPLESDALVSQSKRFADKVSPLPSNLVAYHHI